MNRARLPAVLVALAALPVLLSVWFVQGFSLVEPLFDHWGLLPLFAGFKAGHPSVLGFLALHNGLHATFVLRTLLAALATVTNWSFRAEIYLGFGFVLLTAWALARALRESLPEGEHDVTRAVAFLLTALVLFSPAQDFIWTWSIGVYHHYENAAVAIVVWALASRQPKIGVAVLGCVLATFNRFEGLFTWFLFLPALLGAARERGTVRRSLNLYGAGFAAAVLVCGLLLLVTHPPELAQGPPVESSGFAARALSYAVSLVGMAPGLAFGGVAVVPEAPFLVPGILVLVVFGVLSVRALESPSTRRGALPWVALGAFGLSFAVATAAVRASIARPETTVLARLYQSSYSVTASLTSVAAIHLGALLHVARRAEGRSGRPFVALAASAAAALVLGTVHELPRLLAKRERGHWDRYCLELAAHLAPANACFLAPDGASGLERAGFRTVRHDVVFATATNEAERIERVSAHAEPFWGMRSISITGVAQLPDDSAGTVALSFEGEKKFFALASQFTPLGGSMRFSAEVPEIAVHSGRTQITAWVYDRREGLVRPIAGVVNASELLPGP